MQTVNSTYTALLSAGAKREIRVTIGSTVYGESKIVSCSTESPLFTTFGIGNALASQIDLVLYNPGTIDRMAQMNVELRLVNGSTTSAWLPQGTYFIDTRSYDAESDQLTIHGYDAMLKSEQPMIPAGEPSDTWPKSSTTVMSMIAEAMGVTLDSRNHLVAEYSVGYPSTGTTMRQVMGYIGAMHGGNWIITAAGKLRLVPLVGTGDATALGQKMADLTTAPALPGISRVTLFYDDIAVTAGSDTGYAIEAECPWATQTIVNALLTSLSGYVYRPWTATDALLDPAAELGDAAVISNVSYSIASVDRTYDDLAAALVKAEYEQEVDHEYPYIAPVPRSTQRAINKTRAAINVDLESIRADVEDVETQAHSELLQLADSIQLSVSQATSGGGETYASITLRVGEDTYTGQILLDGNVNVSGQLSADALYAAMGDIADLQVNRLSTSRRIVKYLAGDTSDDNYIHASGEALQFVSGVYSNDSGQAENGNGLPIYWESDPNAQGVVIGTDGYPYKNGVRIYTTTTQTAFPVMVYTYDELVKATVAFENDGVDYVPVLTMGAGDTHGNNRFKLKKSRGGLNLIYTAANGKEVGLTGTTDGFLDPMGLRRIVSLDFSDWHNGEFTIESEGNVELHFGVVFNSQGIPILITGPRSTNVSVTI